MRELFTNLRLRCRALWKWWQLESDLEDEPAFYLTVIASAANHYAEVGVRNPEFLRRSGCNDAGRGDSHTRG
jgi:hypothetical protein